MQYFLYSIGIVECLFLASLVFLKKNRTLSDNILTILFLVTGITILARYLERYNRDLDFFYPWMINIAAPWVMLISPILWLYCKSLTQPQFRVKPVYALHLIPYLVILMRHYVSTYSKTSVEKLQLARGQVIIPAHVLNFFLGFMIAVVFFYTLWCILIIRDHERKIKSIFSNTDKINLNWLRLLFFGALITYALAYGFIIANKFYYFTAYESAEGIGYSLASVFILILGFYGIKQTQIFTSNNLNEYVDTFSKNDEDAPLKKENVTKLTATMAKDKPYLDADLTLKKLAGLTRISETELSSLLNNEFHKNFFDFINSYRIEEFKKQLFNPANRRLTLLGIALNCGFSSKATFNRVFKSHTQMTPRLYKEKMESETSFEVK